MSSITTLAAFENDDGFSYCPRPLYTMPCPKMTNPIDPTENDLRAWAYTEDAEYPPEMSQDWNLMITDFERAPLLLSFASDAQCPNRRFFLGCLYLLAGDCVRPSGRESIPKLERFMSIVPPDAPDLIKLWLRRTKKLLERPETYDYDKWGWVDFSYDDKA